MVILFVPQAGLLEDAPSRQFLEQQAKEVLLKTVRMLDTHEEIIGLSGHLLAVSRKDLI